MHAEETAMDDATPKVAVPEETSSRSSGWLRWLPLVAIVALSAFGFSQGWHQYLSLSELAERREALQSFVSANALLAGLTYFGVYVVAVALSFPGASLITVVGGFLFGWLVGGLLTAFAATTGATIIFLAARTSFGSLLQERAGPRVEKLAEGFRKDAFSYLLFLRLVPLFPFWLINLAPALFNVKLRDFVIATFVGILPGTFAYAWLGVGLDSILAQRAAMGGEFSMADLLTWQLLVAFAALGVVSLIPILVKRLRGRGKSET